jgi:hypothetical protein
MDQGIETVNSSMRAERGAPSKAKNCAECRRLKIKCDRQVLRYSHFLNKPNDIDLKVPCSNCVKRGTSSICPDGQLLPKAQRYLPLWVPIWQNSDQSMSQTYPFKHWGPPWQNRSADREDP